MQDIFNSWSLFYRRTFDYTGRSSRKEFWHAQILVIAYSLLVAISSLVESVNIHDPSRWSKFSVSLIAALAIPLALMSLSLSIRRARDIGLKWWFYLLIVIALASVFKQLSLADSTITAANMLLLSLPTDFLRGKLSVFSYRN